MAKQFLDYAGLQEFWKIIKKKIDVAASKYQPKGNYEAAGAAAQALIDAKSYADSLAVNYDAKGSAATAEQNAKSYADGVASTAKSEAIAQAKLDAAKALEAYYKKTETYSKTEVDGLLSTNSEAVKAYAKQYTDELFNSFKFAANSDIDALFTA